MFQELMHSWVGYKLVKVLLNFGLSPKIWQDLDDWSPDLYELLWSESLSLNIEVNICPFVRLSPYKLS
jgi:hypothetical protein